MAMFGAPYALKLNLGAIGIREHTYIEGDACIVGVKGQVAVGLAPIDHGEGVWVCEPQRTHASEDGRQRLDNARAERLSKGSEVDFVELEAGLIH